MEDEEWVMVHGPPQKDLWKPNLPNADDETPRPLKVTFSEPAEYWVDAIPLEMAVLGT